MLAIAEQWLHSIKIFTVSQLPWQWVGWGAQGVGREQNQDSWPQMTKGYPRLYGSMLSNKTSLGLLKVPVAWRLTGQQSAGGRWWVTAFASLGAGFFSLHLLNHLYLDPQVFLTFAVLILFPMLLGEWSSDWVGA